MKFNVTLSKADADRAVAVEPTTFMYAQAMFEGVRAAHVFWVSNLRSHLEKLLNPTRREDIVKQCLLRIVGLLATLRTIGHPSHFQSISSAARTIFELGLDLALIEKNQSPDLVDQLSAFTRAARLRRAQMMVRFCDVDGHPVPPELALGPLRQHCNDTAGVKEVEGLLEKYWGKDGKGKLIWPDHWSGLDARTRAQGVAAVWEERYMQYYRELSWQVHSGPAGVNGLPKEAFEIIGAQAYRLAGSVAVDAYVIAGRELRLDKSVPDWPDQIEFLKHVPAIALADNKLQSLGEPARFLYLDEGELWPVEQPAPA